MSSRTLTIDPQLKSLFPPLTDEQRAGLEQRIKADGCLSPIIVWKSKNVIVDGHNRYEICKKINVPFEVEEIDFKNVGEVLEWMWQVQSFRRNWTPEQAKLALGFVYNEQKQDVGRPAEEEKPKAAAKPAATKTKTDAKPADKKSSDKKQPQAAPKPEPVPQAEATAERLAKEHNVSPRQVQIAGKFAQEIAEIEEKCGVDAKNAIVMRSIKSSADTVSFLAALPKHDAQKVATQIKRGEAASLKEAIVAAGFKLPKKAKKKAAQEKEKILTPPAAFKNLDALIGQIARAIDMTATATGGQTVRSRECHSKLGTLATAITEWKRTVKK